MLVLLPPSETKAVGGDGPALAWDALCAPELIPVRAKLADELVALSVLGGPTALGALGLSAGQTGELQRNIDLAAAPTLPALHRYTGVLYDALAVDRLGRAERARATGRLAVASALFGVLRADDPIPGYRLSAGSMLPGLGSVRSVWRPVLTEAVLGLAAGAGVVVDLRSQPYAALAPLPGAVTVRVLAEDGAGRRATVSHHNKAHKGRLARILATTRAEPADAAGVARVARRGGLRVERRSDLALDVIVAG